MPTGIVIRIRKFFHKLLRVIVFLVALYRRGEQCVNMIPKSEKKNWRDMKCDSNYTNAFKSSVLTELYTATVNHYNSINNIQKWKYF